MTSSDPAAAMPIWGVSSAINAAGSVQCVGVIEFPLTRGYVTVIDEADWPLVGAFKWYACVSPKGRVYAERKYYIDVRIRKTAGMLLHRRLLNAPKGMLVDHKNGDTLDNRRENLRLCGYEGNARNSRKLKPGLCRFKGIRLNKPRTRYQAHITMGGVTTYLGTFDTDIEAALAYDHAAKQMFGEFAGLNFPDGFPVLHVSA